MVLYGEKLERHNMLWDIAENNKKAIKLLQEASKNTRSATISFKLEKVIERLNLVIDQVTKARNKLLEENP